MSQVLYNDDLILMALEEANAKLTAREIIDEVKAKNRVHENTLFRCLRRMRENREVNYKEIKGYANQKWLYWMKKGY